ncbi:MAG: hypothetical protein JXM70_08260 [Pirellulales bacterium]|nr:hypothetical protein [Pirellulales bacterium]
MNSSGKRFTAFIPYMLAAIVTLSVCAGCGGGGKTENAEVVGSVSFDGKPLTQGNVQFDTQDGIPAGGTIGPEGRFNASASNAKGVSPGPCRIAVIVTQQQSHSAGVDRFQPPKWLIPKAFGSTSTSGLQAEIKPVRNEFKIALFSNGRGSVTRVE